MSRCVLCRSLGTSSFVDVREYALETQKLLQRACELSRDLAANATSGKHVAHAAETQDRYRERVQRLASELASKLVAV